MAVERHDTRTPTLAAMPADPLDTAVATAKATACEGTTAFILLGTQRHAPPKKITQADCQQLTDLEAAQARGASITRRGRR